jgi:predicted dehydrogenase
MKKFRTGIVGVGFIGAAHIEALRRLGNIDVVAVCARYGADRIAQSQGVEKSYSDYRDMIDNENLDFVHICTPNDTHCEIALYAMDHNVNVVCEKPMCCTVEEADLMIAKAKEKHLVNGVNFHNRWYPMTAQLRQMARAGEFGGIHAVYGEFVQDWLLYDTDYSWRVEAGKSGKTRAVSDIGSHWMDLVENITGLEITEVCADFMTLHETRKKPISAQGVQSFKSTDSETVDIPINTEDHASLLFRMNNGAIGTAVFSQVIAGRKASLNINIAGAKQSANWCCDTCNQAWLGRRSEHSVIFDKDPAFLDPAVSINAGYPAGHGEGFPDAFKNSFRAIYSEAGSPSENPEYANFETGKHELILCDKIFESAKNRCWVSVK